MIDLLSALENGACVLLSVVHGYLYWVNDNSAPVLVFLGLYKPFTYLLPFWTSSRAGHSQPGVKNTPGMASGNLFPQIYTNHMDATVAFVWLV